MSIDDWQRTMHLNTTKTKKKGMKCPSKIAKTHVKESIPLIPEGGLKAPAEKSSCYYYSRMPNLTSADNKLHLILSLSGIKRDIICN